ncbi:S1 family peptidase [Acaryochloris marina NIES-2412]|uniref:S1 family peptidase n=1 Tax=Acaryochloris marina TaxID=155978 RepID=UPI0040597C24
MQIKFLPSRAATLALTTALALSPQLNWSVQANETKSGPQINEISQQTTLLITRVDSEGNLVGWGSGSLLSKNGQTCTGVTNEHVMKNKGQKFKFLVRTYDRKIRSVTNARMFADVDLALFSFECKRNYKTIPVADYPLSPGQQVHLSGWPADSNLGATTFTRQFTSGTISTILDKPFGGYQVGYTNVTNSGMSGGQVLDSAGRLVAIHGAGALEDSQSIATGLNVPPQVAVKLAKKTGFNYGIPVSTLLAYASQSGLNSGFDVANTPPKSNGSDPSSSDYTYTPGKKDKVNVDKLTNNIDKSLGTVEKGAKIICRFFGC